MTQFLLRVPAREFVVLWIAFIVGIPVAMTVFSVALPPMRNPLFLVVGGLVGFLVMRQFWLMRQNADR